MDFLDFIPSRTVKDFVRKSNYQLTAKDAACIVFVSDKTIREKHEGYRAIIDAMPDCKIGNKKHCGMLHETLSALIAWEDKFVSVLKTSPNMLGGGNVLVKRDCLSDMYDNAELFTLYNEIHNRVYLSEREFVDSAKLFPKRFLDDSAAFTLNAHIANNDINYISATYNTDWELIEADPSFSNSNADKEYSNIVRLIAHIPLSDKFPLPFEAGDLICRGKKYISDSKDAEYFDARIEVVDIVERDNKKTYNLYSYFGLFSCLENVNKNLLCAEIIEKNQLPKKYYMTIAVSALLKREIDLAQFLKLYDYNNGEMQCKQLAAKTKQLFKKVGILV